MSRCGSAMPCKTLGLVVGDGVVSAANVVGQGVVTFGSDAQKFSLAGGGAIVDWTQTTAGEVQSWTVGTAGNIAAFSKSVYAEAKQDCLAAANFAATTGAEWAAFIASLFTSKLPKLGGYDDAARSVANVLFPPWPTPSPARRDETGRRSVSISSSPSVRSTPRRSVRRLDGTLGLYDTLRLTLDTLNINTSSLTSVSGTIEVITVFGPRDAFSERAVVSIGGTIRGVYGGIGAGCTSPRAGTLSASASRSCWASHRVRSKPGEVEASLAVPKPNGEAIALGMNAFNKAMSDGGPSWEAATRALLSPDQEGAHRRHCCRGHALAV